jgi:amidohydrolase
MKNIQIPALIDEILPQVQQMRHDLHRHPELAYEEKRTAAKVVEFLDGLDGVEIRPGIAGTGLAVTIGRHLEGPCVALRADMDALAIDEQSGVEWSSATPGKMHACGHDGHTAMLAGAARLLAGLQDQLAGPVKFIFQPAEEGGAGARRMCEEGVLDDPEVSAIFGLHNNLPAPDMEFGQIVYSKGAAMAGTGTFDIEVIGAGGHAAFPHRCVDPVYIGSCIVDQLQGIVSRSVDPLTPAVISVTRFHAGTAYNIIPPKATLHGTLRALDTRTLEHLREHIIRCATDVARAHGAEVKIRCDLGYPVLVNNPHAEAVFLTIVEDAGIPFPVREVSPILGGEDFAFYAERIPAFFYFLPACKPDGTPNYVCHHPSFDFNDELLPHGIRLHLETALRFARLWKA